MRRNQRWLAILIVLSMVFTMIPLVSFGAEKSDDIVILATADMHAYIDKEGVGFPGLRAIQKDTQKRYKNVLLVDNGDMFQGSRAGFLTKGQAVVELVNASKYDVMSPGNHDFDYGVEYYLDQIVPSLKTAQVTSCNFRKANSQTPYFKPYVIKEMGGKKIAFVGITTPETLITSRPTNFYDEQGNKKYDFYGGNEGKELIAQINKSVNAARDAGADYVIALGHLGDYQGLDNPWSSQSIIKSTAGIDVFVDGHDHQINSNKIKNKSGNYVPRIKMGANGENIGKITIKTDGTIETELIDKFSLTDSDEEYNKLFDKISSEIDRITGQKIGTSKYHLITHDEDGNRLIRNQETNLGDFCADAIRAVMGSDIAIINGGGIRSDLKKGDITNGSILDIFPFGNMICECEASGQEILDALELGAMNIGKGAGADEFGGFLQVSGLTYKIDPSITSTVVLNKDSQFVKVKGKRKVYGVMFGDKPLNKKATYTISCHNFKLKSGGDGFVMFKDNKFTQDEVILDSELLMEYIEKNLHGVIGAEYATPQNRIVVEKKQDSDIIAEYAPKLKAKSAVKSVKLSWNSVGCKGVKYKVYRKLKNGKYKLIKTTSKTKYTVNKLKRKTTYKFRIRASKTNEMGTFNSAYSKTIKCKTK